ncbi:sodium:solute symporter [Alicyclobacillus kakegawensis]|uniref:sodium:solute symporter n=1 Tax=Alicyclobacillus kakegawensis TaxID=392012 RepID=UPI0009FA8A4A|nr:sodium:solute symporter [Alicyclobacillus kakegawensis]
MHSLDIIVLVLYFAVMIFVGFLGVKKVGNSEEYALAGRNLGFFRYVGCLSAVVLGGASTIGTASLGYQYGISGMWLVVMIGLGIVAIGLIFIGRIRPFRVVTISELLAKRFDSQSGLVAAIVIAIYDLMNTVTQIIAIGSIGHVLAGWNLTASMIIGGGVVIFYTLLGGMWSVTMTDIIQFVLMTVGICFIMLPISLSNAGGWGGLLSHLPRSDFHLTHIGVWHIVQYFFLYTLGLVVSQDVMQRVFTARNGVIQKLGTISAGIYSILYAIAISIIGMCAIVVLPHLNDAQSTFTSLSLTILPTGLLGLLLASLCSAIMSTASGTLIAASTLISHDIINKHLFPGITERKLVQVSRMITLALGVVAIAFAAWIQQVIVALDVAYAILAGSIFLPLALGLFWKKVTAKAAFYSIILSAVVVIVSLGIDGLNAITPIIYGFMVSLVCIVGLTLITGRSASSVSSSPSSVNKTT